MYSARQTNLLKLLGYVNVDSRSVRNNPFEMEQERKRKGPDSYVTTPAKKTKRSTPIKTASTPAPAPVPEPAGAPPVVTATQTKKKPKEMSDEIKKLLRSLAAGTQKVQAADLDDCTVKDLKLALKLNDRPMTGNRATVVNSVCDGINNGCPPRCPACFGGRLRYGYGVYWCPGYMDDDEFKSCSFQALEGDITRIPWKSP